MSCPCGNPEELEQCCGRYLSGGAQAPTAEALMRARYTAYTVDNIDFVVATHVPKGREDIDKDQAHQWATESEWLGLEIVATDKGQTGDKTGVVEFIAKYSVKGSEFSHHERSEFRCENDEWFYADGEMIKAKPVVREAPKVGRNEPCPCGSGKKFKKCCAA